MSELMARLRAARRENKRFRALMMSQALEAWATDAHGQMSELICDDGDGVLSGDVMPLAHRLEHVHPEDLPELLHVIAQARATGIEFETVIRGRRLDSKWRRLRVRGFPVMDEKGAVEEWVGLVSDLTEQDEIQTQNRELTARLQLALQKTVAELSERKRVEQELLSQNLVLERIVAGAPLVDILTDIVLSVERRVADTIGSVMLLDDHQRLNFSAGPNLPSEYVAQLVDIPIGPQVGSCGTAAYTGRPEIVSDIATHPAWEGFRHWVLPHGLQACWSVPITARVQTKCSLSEDGQASTSRLCDDQATKPCVLGTFALYQTQPCSPSDTDLEIVSTAAYAAAIAIERELSHKALRESEIRLARQSAELRHASRISSLGLMAAAISHEINQPLNAISNYAATCQLYLKASESTTSRAELKACFEKLSSAALQAGEIVRRLRSFARKEQHRREKHDFNAVIRDALALTTPELRSRHVRVELSLATGAAAVLGDAVQLQQVLVNLLANAAEAMAAQPSDQRSIFVGSSLTEKVVECRVVDTGPGFSPELKERLFEPMLTTKSHGSGIGLSICRNIVEDHGGTIVVDNGAHGGAEIVIHLPLTDS